MWVYIIVSEYFIKQTSPTKKHMNSVNHFIFALSLSLIFFRDLVSMKMMILLVIVFSVFIDLDQLIVYLKNNKKESAWLKIMF